jgi:hypothetical protein
MRIDMKQYTAVYEVFAGTVVDNEADLEGLTPGEMAERIDATAEPDVGLCHQCSHSVIDPQVGDLVAFTVDGVEYTQRDGDGEWVASQ